MAKAGLNNIISANYLFSATASKLSHRILKPCHRQAVNRCAQASKSPFINNNLRNSDRITSAKLSSRFNFTYHFLVGSASLTRLAQIIDDKGFQTTENERNQHLGYVCGAIMQAVCALESEAWNLYNHGVGHHLGSNGIASEVLKTVAGDIEKISILPKYVLALKLARHKTLDLGSQPMQDTALLISLRNELVHYKSLSSDDIEMKKVFISLEKKDKEPPSFYIGNSGNFFPLACLTYRRAKWALTTVISFIEHFYSCLDIKSPLNGFNKNLLQV